MRRVLISLWCTCGTLALLGVAVPAIADADSGVTLVGNEIRVNSDSQDAENLVISIANNMLNCNPSAIPCLQLANGPQKIRDEVAGASCNQLLFNGQPFDTIVTCSPPGAFTSIRLTLNDGEDFAVMGDNVPPATIEGGDDNDNLTSGNRADTVRGGPGDDEISDDDTTAADVLDGGADDDSISVSRGNDDVSGGPGVDTVRLDSGDDTVHMDDVANDGPPGQTKNIHTDIEIVDGDGGSDNLFGNALANTFRGGAGNDFLDAGSGPDVLQGDTGGDELIGGTDVDRVVYPENAAQTITLDDARNDGAAGELDNVHSDIEDVAAGPGNDDVTGSDLANVLDGGPGDDRLAGRGGVDTFFGGDGADSIFARDGLQERVECGPGVDTGEADTIDFLVDCEGVVVSSELVPDVDGDGSNKPLDCDDGNPAIHPGAIDVPRNGVDEDCVGGDADFPVSNASISFRFDVFRTFTRLTRFRAVRLTGGERIRLRCKGRGCPFKVKRLTVAKAGSRNMTKLVRKARFRKRAVLKVFITKPQTVGRFARFKFRAAKAPTLRKRCLQPGATQPSKCPPGAG